MVRQVVVRTFGGTMESDGRAASPPPSRIILDADMVRQLPVNTPYPISPSMLITPLAREVALERGIDFTTTDQMKTDTSLPSADNRTVALGADHGGFQLKEQLKEVLEKASFKIIDCGTHSRDAVDYPDYAYAVAQLVANGRAWRGIMIDGAGIGSCMAANKVPGVRAAMCYDQATAVNSREHNNANVLTLGAGLIGPALASQIVTTWLNTEFGGGRHARRVDKIEAIGKRFSRGA